ncbi:MAG: alpha/beta hydrolase-fold protein [Bacteroidota bacterium]
MKNLLLLFAFITISVSQHSRIELHSHFSTTLGISKSYNILFPEGYDSESNHYPVMYLFRGAVDEWADPLEDASRRGNIKTVVDSLYAKNRIGKMILVMPGLSAPATANEYTYITNDLIPHIDTTYRTIPTRWHRAMDGFSLGGLIVTNLMAGAPQLFCSAGSYDGTLSLFNNSLFSNASPSLIYSLSQMQLLYHTASVGGNNNANNQTTFSILNSKGIYNSLPSFLLNPSASHNWYYADWHMGISLPLHWQKIASTGNMLNTQFLDQFNTKKQSGTDTPAWEFASIGHQVRSMLFVTSNRGNTWTRLLSTTDSVRQYSWNTSTYPDGTLYALKIIAASDTLFGSDEMLPFTIDNPGNAVPDIYFSDMPDTLRGMGSIGFYASDADGDALNLSLSVSHNDGQTWVPLDSASANTGTFPIDFSMLPNGHSVRFKLSAADNIVTSTTITGSHVIDNKRYSLAHVDINHVTGISDAVITVTTGDPTKIIQSDYDIVIHVENGVTTYSVINSLGVEVVKNATELDGVTEGPLFDGMRLLIKNYPSPTVHHDSTRWSVGSSPLTGYTSLIDVFMEFGTVVAAPLPYDYEIRISNSIVDTTLGLFGTAATPIPFIVWNTTLDRKSGVVFVEIDMNGIISRNDELFIIENDSLHPELLTWHVQFVGNEGSPNPVAGDILKIRILKPLTNIDSYRFTAIPVSVRNTIDPPLRYFLDQNYPNPFNPVTTIRFSVEHPGNVTVKIFDLLGREISRPVNNYLPGGVYDITWNAAGFSSGIYFYQFESGSYTQVRKMVILK